MNRRAVMVANSDSGKRIWPTEFGWASSQMRQDAVARDITPDEQAQYLVRAYQMSVGWVVMFYGT
jgi:hypothetical protein